MNGTSILEKRDQPLPPPDAFGAPPAETDVGNRAHDDRHRWIPAAVVAGLVIALVAGVIIGRAGMQPRVDDLTAERDDLAGLVDDLTAERDTLAGDLADLTAQRETLTLDLDDLAAERDGLTGDLADLTAERDTLSERFSARLADLESLSADNDELGARLNDAREAAAALVFIELNITSEFVDAFRESGGDVTMFDDILVTLGRDETADEWAASWGDYNGPWQQADAHVRGLGDDALLNAWWDWNEAESGSDEQWVAQVTLYLGLYDLLLEHLELLDTATS